MAPYTGTHVKSRVNRNFNSNGNSNSNGNGNSNSNGNGSGNGSGSGNANGNGNGNEPDLPGAEWHQGPIPIFFIGNYLHTFDQTY